MNLNFNNINDLQNFLKSPSKSKTDGPIDLAMPKLDKFLKMVNIPEGWTHLERYMSINGNPIKKSFSEFANKKIFESNDYTFYRNGTLIEKKDNMIVFTSYTIDQGICVFNNILRLDINGNLIGGDTNMFALGILSLDDNIMDGKIYLDELLDELISEKSKFKWDIVK